MISERAQSFNQHIKGGGEGAHRGSGRLLAQRSENAQVEGEGRVSDAPGKNRLRVGKNWSKD